MTFANILYGGYPTGIGILMKQKLLPEMPGVPYCPSRTTSRFSVGGIPGQNLDWSQWTNTTGGVENSYVYLGPRKMNWINTPFCLAADVFIKDTGEDGAYLGTFFGAPRDHGGNYYNTLFSDNSVRKYIDHANYFPPLSHYQMDTGMTYLTSTLQ